MTPLTEQNARLVAENAQLRSLLTFADKKVKALTVFASSSDNSLGLLASQPTDCSPIIEGVNAAVSEFNGAFSSLEDLSTAYEDPEEMKETSAMARWVAGEDHIQMEQEQKLKEDRDLE